MPRDAVVVVPGRIDARTGGSIYDRRIADGLRKVGWRIQVQEVSTEFPFPSAAAMADAADGFRRLPDGALAVVDGLVFSVIADIAEREAKRLRLVALVHLPLAADVTRDPETARQLEQGERRALRSASRIVVTGKSTLPLLASCGVSNIAVVEPGTDPAPPARGSGGPRVELLTVATVHQGKGHELLVNALASLPHRDWHLTCAGSLERDPQTATRVRHAIRDANLESSISLAGELDDERLAACYDKADVFVLPTLQETYGMAVAEALARGLPVISTATGAIADLVGADAGILVPPGDGPALAKALGRVLGAGGDELRRTLANGALRVRERLRTWDEAARELDAVLSGIA